MYRVLLLQRVLFVDTLKVLEVIGWVFLSFGLSLFEECAWQVIMVMTCDRKAASLKYWSCWETLRVGSEKQCGSCNASNSD